MRERERERERERVGEAISDALSFPRLGKMSCSDWIFNTDA